MSENITTVETNLPFHYAESLQEPKQESSVTLKTPGEVKPSVQATPADKQSDCVFIPSENSLVCYQCGESKEAHWLATWIEHIENGGLVYDIGQLDDFCKKGLNRLVHRGQIAKIKTMWPWTQLGVKKTGYCLPHLATHFST